MHSNIPYVKEPLKTYCYGLDLCVLFHDVNQIRSYINLRSVDFRLDIWRQDTFGFIVRFWRRYYKYFKPVKNFLRC